MGEGQCDLARPEIEWTDDAAMGEGHYDLARPENDWKGDAALGRDRLTLPDQRVS